MSDAYSKFQGAVQRNQRNRAMALRQIYMLSSLKNRMVDLASIAGGMQVKPEEAQEALLQLESLGFVKIWNDAATTFSLTGPGILEVERNH